MKPISTSTFTFADLVGGGYVYVDKTATIHALAEPGKGQYFLARPRRFERMDAAARNAGIAFPGRPKIEVLA